MSIDDKPALARFIDLRRRRKRGQFGQANDSTTFDGRTACTHTVWQDIIELWTGKVVTHDELSAIAGYPSPATNPKRRGFRVANSLRVIRHFRLPYEVAPGIGVEDLLRSSNLAPCLYAVRYKDHPAETDALVSGHGFRNGTAVRNGANQAEGFDGAHACELGGYLPVFDPAKGDKPVAYKAYVMEPNHGSAARPGVDYDVISTAQLRVALESLLTVPGFTHTLAFIPTRRLPA